MTSTGSTPPDLLPSPIKSDGEHGPDYARNRGDGRAGSGGDDLVTTVFRDILPTPVARDHKGVGLPRERGDGLPDVIAELLPTPSVSNRDGNTENNRGEALLPGAAIAMLPTPAASIASGGQVTADGATTRENGTKRQVSLADSIRHGTTVEPSAGEKMLPTPRASDGPNQRGGSGDLIFSSVDLLFPAAEAGDDPEGLLPTPTAWEQRGDGDSLSRQDRNLLPNAVARLEAGELLPTPVTEPETGNGHARDLGSDVGSLLLPTPVAHESGGTPENHLRKKSHRTQVTSLGIVAEHGILDRGGNPAGAVDPTESITADGTPVRWGKFRAAVMRAEQAAGRPAPAPTLNDGKGGKPRLAARFVEWMMMLPEGWVTEVPGVNRRDQLKMLGNGVVPAQASAATVILLARVQQTLSERRERQGTP